MPDVPAQKILALIANLRTPGFLASRGDIADMLQKMVNDEIEAVDAYYEQMAQEAYEMEDGRRVMEDAAVEKSLRYLDEV